MGEGNKGHQCECNLCGDTLSDRAMDLANAKFEQLKKEFEANQKENTTLVNGNGTIEKASISDENLHK
jgi:hypothetical protein